MGRLANYIWRSDFFPRKLSFTREGRVVFVVAVGLGIAAVNTGNNLLYLVFGLSLALIVLSGILSETNLRGIRCDPMPEIRGTAAGSTLVVLRVRSVARRRPAYSLEAWPDVPGASVVPARFLVLPPSGEAEGVVRLTFPRRGEFPVRGLVVATTFPFGFFRKALILPSPTRVLVHPRVHPVPGAEVSPSAPGEERGRPLPGAGGDFLGLRDFRPGDPPKWIAHRRSAGLDPPLVREFERLASPVLWVALSNILPPGKDGEERLEQAIEKAASLAVAAIRRGRRVGLVSLSGVVDPGAGEAQAMRLLDALATTPALEMNPPGVEGRLEAVLRRETGAEAVFVRP